jgi:hypothetical protein
MRSQKKDRGTRRHGEYAGEEIREVERQMGRWGDRRMRRRGERRLE